ncbi:MAG: hypothetical protein E6K52_12815 [Gammaproteobacteria bacterium]|nr:MAG: hypothetical protein E6K52_12815 [Gammaproteobacteria bacterium]
MRLSPLSPEAARLERRERWSRDRAAAQALRTAFPKVAQLRLDLTFSGAGSTTPVSQSHVLHPPAQAFFGFPCPYADCDGHFDLSAVVTAALRSSVRHIQGTQECAGVRARDRAGKQLCNLQLNYVITADYRREA